MPEGPLGFPRLTTWGPFVEPSWYGTASWYETEEPELDNEGTLGLVERATRQPVIDMDNITGAGRPTVEIHGISKIFQGWGVGEYRVDTGNIELTYEIATAFVEERGRWENYLQAVVAHEYCHHILSLPEDRVARICIELYEEGLFDYEELDDVVEFYDFPPEQYKDYGNIIEFAEDLKTFPAHSDSRQVEGFANITGITYAQMTFDGYREKVSKIRGEKADEYLELAKTGDVWTIPSELERFEF